MGGAKVWVVNSSGHNFEEAEKYGTLVPLTMGRINVFNVDRLLDEFKHKLKHFGEEDWLLLSGNVVLNVLATMVVSHKHSRVKLLVYDVARKTYVPREVSVEDIKQ